MLLPRELHSPSEFAIAQHFTFGGGRLEYFSLKLLVEASTSTCGDGLGVMPGVDGVAADAASERPDVGGFRVCQLGSPNRPRSIRGGL